MRGTAVHRDPGVHAVLSAGLPAPLRPEPGPTPRAHTSLAAGSPRKGQTIRAGIPGLQAREHVKSPSPSTCPPT
ncbi:hypothetical protein C1I97_30620 [Streptomyces sp. NTH33]|nr:hypothetical protein C1I97_30620 [Streptomyces sp. NTH33]